MKKFKDPKYKIDDIVIIDPTKRFAKEVVKELNAEFNMKSAPYVQGRIMKATYSSYLVENKKIPTTDGWLYTIVLVETDGDEDIFCVCAEKDLIKIK